MRKYRDAEDFFKSVQQAKRMHSAEDDLEKLRLHYKRQLYSRPWLDCSAWAELTIWEMDRMQKLETIKWESRSYYEQVRLRMCLRWLERLGIREITYEGIVRDHWEDIAVLLYLWSNPVIQSTYPALTDELLL